MKKYKASHTQLTLEGFESELKERAMGSVAASKTDIEAEVDADGDAENKLPPLDSATGFEPDTSFLSEYYNTTVEADHSDYPDVSLPWATPTGRKVGRNDPCPCGSGKKYKKCCGANIGKKTRVTRYEEDPYKNTDPPPTLAQWDRLYQAARLIRSIEPWEYLWSSDLITIVSQAGAEPVYCSVMGRAEYRFAIGVYPGYDAVNTLFRVNNADSSIYEYIEGMGQKCLMCYFGDREELKEKDREIIKSLNIRFWGRNEWIFFRALDPGMSPWFISGKQADLLARSLLNVAHACRYYIENTPREELDDDETILRFYSPEKGLWLNTITDLGPIRVDMTTTSVSDVNLLSRLKKIARNGMELELDVIWLPIPLRIRRKDRPSYPRLIFLMDRSKINIIVRRFVVKGESLTHSVMDLLIDYVEEKGKPKSIHVRDERVSNIIGDLCSKIGIQVIEGEEMFATETLLEDMLEIDEDDDDDDDEDDDD